MPDPIPTHAEIVSRAGFESDDPCHLIDASIGFSNALGAEVPTADEECRAREGSR